MINKPTIIFAGTPEISAHVLSELLKEYEVALILSQPDRPKGRGRKLLSTPVKEIALKNNIHVLQPSSLRDASIQNKIKELHPDIMIVIAYGLLIPQEILNIPRCGCINIHTSILPKYRGASPISAAILNGDKITGITIIQMDKGMDSGPILLTENINISETETTSTLTQKMATTGAKALVANLDKILKHELLPTPQDSSKASLAPKILKDEAIINWNEDSDLINRKIRAYTPWPTAHTQLNNTRIRIISAQAINRLPPKHAQPGEVIQFDKNDLLVACNNSILKIEQLQMPGSKVLLAQQILSQSKQPIKVGSIFSN